MGKLQVTLVPIPEWRNPLERLRVFFGYRDQANAKKVSFDDDRVLVGVNTDVFGTSPPDVIRVTVEWGGTPGEPLPSEGTAEEALPSRE